MALVVPYWVVSLLVLVYVPLAVLVRVPASVTAVASLSLAALLVSLLSEATLLPGPDLAPPLTVAMLLAGASTAAACAAVVHRDQRLGMTAGVSLPVPLLARCGAALVLIGWVTIIIVWQLAPQVHLAPEDDVEPGEAFGISVLAIWPYAVATTWMVPAGVAGVLGRLFPALIAFNALILLGATTWVRLGFRLDELVPMTGPALQWGTRLAAVALSLLAALCVRDELRPRVAPAAGPGSAPPRESPCPRRSRRRRSARRARRAGRSP